MEKPKKKRKIKLPNRTDIPIDIPNFDNIRVEKKHPFYDRYDTMAKSFTFTASSIPSDWLDKIKPLTYEETTVNPTTDINHFRWFFSPKERNESKVANLRLKARNMLDKPFSATNAYNEFGAEKFPNSQVDCMKCGREIVYVVDFFIHCILDHRASLQSTVTAFEQVLDRIH